MSTNSVLLITIDGLRRDFLGAYRDRPRVVDCADALSELNAPAEQFERFGLSRSSEPLRRRRISSQ
ncbi:hypothetical protein BRC91_08195 [Halobacteriales archaeon QS_4_62_28]|nr:MAG: hypothetical protein BRC91_08195 [Halobacteriales archaeon QS_4_62_28]